MVEQDAVNVKVVGSNPTFGANSMGLFMVDKLVKGNAPGFHGFDFHQVHQLRVYGRLTIFCALEKDKMPAC